MINFENIWNENWVTRIRKNYHRVPRIRKIGSLQVHTMYLTVSLKRIDILKNVHANIITKPGNVFLEKLNITKNNNDKI